MWSNKCVCPNCNSKNNVKLIVKDVNDKLKLEIEDERVLCSTCEKLFIAVVTDCNVTVDYSIKSIKG